MSESKVDVLIAGAGPTGLTLANALMLKGLSVTVVDSQEAGANTSRAAVIHARTLEALEAVGVAERLVAQGVQASRFTIRDRDRVLVPVHFENLPTRYPYTLMISQAETETILLRRLDEAGGRVERPCTVVDVEQNADGVIGILNDGRSVQARYVVGADGMHSTIRERAGIAFPGSSYGESFSLADVRLTGRVPDDEVILYFSPAGLVVVAPLPDGVHRIVATVDQAPENPDVEFVQALLDRRGPERERVVVQEVLWGSRFRVHHRIAEAFRSGRIMIAGDAAHVHSPAGGQGMNTGIQDAVILADALASAIESGSSDALREYDVARRTIAHQVVKLADRLTRLATAGPHLRPLRNALLGVLGGIPAFRSRLAWRLSGLVYRPNPGDTPSTVTLAEK